MKFSHVATLLLASTFAYGDAAIDNSLRKKRASGNTNHGGNTTTTNVQWMALANYLIVLAVLFVVNQLGDT